jgi:hypothetical protein
MAAVKTGCITEMSAANDTIAGKILLAGIIIRAGAAAGATVVNINGTGGQSIYSATPSASTTLWYAPWGRPIIVDDIFFKTKGNNVTIAVVESLWGAAIPKRVSLT